MKTLAKISIGDSKLEAENQELRRRLEEVEETLRAIRNGTVDALVLNDADGERIYTLESADRPYRLLVEQMQQAAVTLAADGTIAYSNRRLADLLGVPHPKLAGAAMADFIPPDDRPAYEATLRAARSGSCHCEISLSHADGARIPVLITVNELPSDTGVALGVLITDLTSQRHHEQLAAAHEALRRAAEFDEAVMANMGEGLYTVDAEGFVTSMNPAAERLFGWSLEELRGRKMHDLTHHHHPDGSPFPAEECAGLQVLKQGRTLIDHEDVFIRKDGTFFDVVYSSSPLKTGGEITGLVVVFRDVSARNQAEKALRESEQRFRMMADNISQLAWTCDQLGEVTWYNRRWLDYTGMTFEEMRDWGWTRCHHPDHVARVVESVRRSRESGEIWQDTFPLRGKEGEYRWFLSRAYPIRDEHGKVVRWFGTNTDITELREVQTQLAAANEQLYSRAKQLDTLVEQRTAKLQETIGELEAFSYSITHDLRAPLRAMQGFARMVHEDYASVLNDIGKDYLRRIATSADRMDKLIQDVLQYSRVLRMDLKLAPVDVARLLRGMLETYSDFQEPRADVAIEGELPPALGNEAALTQCFSNLLTNATKFVPAKTKPRVRISAERNGDFIRYWVADNGIGIERRHWEQIYGMFQRLHTKYEGTGIGLSILRKAVERMGGRNGVESELGHGSRFWIELKAAGDQPAQKL